MILEAAACGTPVAGFVAPGPQDILPNTGGGVVDTDLRKACLEALKLSREGARALAENYSWRSCAEEFRRNLEELTTFLVYESLRDQPVVRGLEAIGLKHPGMGIEQILVDAAFERFEHLTEEAGHQLRELVKHRVLARRSRASTGGVVACASARPDRFFGGWRVRRGNGCVHGREWDRQQGCEVRHHASAVETGRAHCGTALHQRQPERQRGGGLRCARNKSTFGLILLIESDFKE